VGAPPRGLALLLVAPVLVGCSGPTASGVTTLAKADRWAPPLDVRDQRFNRYDAILEIAYDEATARAAWDAAVPADLPERSGDPREPGRYGSFEDLDLEEEVMVVFSGGQSGTCPGWLRDVSVDGGEVHLEQHREGDSCTSDYRAFRVVLAVDRDKVPSAGELPTEDVVIAGRRAGLVTTYPAR
jgi:hypothetical protein